MRLLVGILLISLVAGCGGGSDGAVDIPVKVNNTAPVLVGPLTMQLTANSLGETNLALQDADNDALTVSYTNKPAWVEGVTSGNQLKLTAKPGFIHVGSHQFSLRVADGKSHSDYTITLNVSDDPTKWVQIATEKAAFIGQWSLSTGNDLHLYDNDKGRFFSSDGEVYDLTWSAKNGYIEISSKQVNCVADCVENIEVFVIENDGARKRLVFESDAQNLSVTAVPYTAKTVKSGTYTPSHTAVDFVNTIKGTAAEFYLPFELAVYGNAVRGWAKVNTQLTANGKLQPQQNFYQTELNVLRNTSHNSEELEFNISLTSAEIIPSAENRLTLKYELSYTLKDSNLNPNDFVDLNEVLDTPVVGFIELRFSEQLAVPQFSFNSPYISAFRLSTTVDGQRIETGATEVVFTDNTKGVARFKTPETFTPLERDFTWTIEQQQLVIKLEGKESRFSFIQHPINGVSLVTENRFHYPFMTRDKQYNAQALMGNFLLEQDRAEELAVYHNIFADNTAMLFSTQLAIDNFGSASFKWQQESDGSITFINGSLCNRTATFAVCAADLKRRFANGDRVVIYYRNYKVIKQTDKHTYIQSTLSYKYQSEIINFESVIRLVNIK